MKTGINTRKNYFFNVLCELVTTLIPLITTPYITRVLGTDGVGAYNYTLTVVSYFVLFGNCGIRIYGSRCIAAVKDDPDARDRAFTSLFLEQLLLAAAMLLCYGGYVLSLGGGSEYKTLFAIFALSLFSASAEITWLYYGMERFAPVALGTIAVKLAAAVCTFVFINTPDDLPVYVLLTALSSLLVQVVLWCGAGKLVRFARVTFPEIRAHVLPCLALLIPSLAPTLYRAMDKLMLEGAAGKSAVGLYSTAEQLQTCMLGFITGLGTVMLPRVTNLLSRGEKRAAEDCVGDSMQFSVFIGCAFAFGIASVADTFVPLYYGDAFSEAALLTTVFSFTILFISWSEVIRSQVILPNRYDALIILSILSGAAVNLLSNLFFIGFFGDHAAALGLSEEAAGALGALPGTLLAECTVALVQILFLRKKLPFGTYFRSCAVFVIAGAGMFAAVRGIRAAGAGVLSVPVLLLAQIAVGGLVYLAVTGGWYFCFRRETLAKLFRGTRK